MYICSAFLKQKYFLLGTLKRTGVVVVKPEVVGLGPGSKNKCLALKLFLA
jgi:hypothetical protein